MQRLEVDGAVRPLQWSLGVKGLFILELSCKIVEKYPNTKFHENPTCGSPFVPYGYTDGQTDMTKLTIPFSNFANAPKKTLIDSSIYIHKTCTAIFARRLDSCGYRTYW